MKDSRVLSKLNVRTATEFLSFIPELNTNYINVVDGDKCLELFRDRADIFVVQDNPGENVAYIAICLSVRTERFELYIPESFENQKMKLVSEMNIVGKKHLMIFIEVCKFPDAEISIQQIQSGKTTEYYLNPYSSIYSKNPF